MRRQFSLFFVGAASGLAAAVVILVVSSASCQESPAAPSPGNTAAATKPTGAAKADAPMPVPAGFVPLAKTYDVWISTERKLVIVDGKVCLNEGQLEMFACPKKSKEHESLVAVNSDAKTVHAALLAVGAVPGSPVKFDPKFSPPTGTQVDITVLWTDREGKQHKRPAQDWVRHVRTKKQLESSWVFAGSGFWTDDETRQKHYQADAGDLVCVSNFPTAMLDLPVESSKDNADLQFEAFTERMPPVGTPVRLVFQPRIVPKPVAEK